MSYTKPDFIVMPFTVVQGCPPGSKLGFIIGEFGPPPCWVTAAAYEADE